MTYEAKILKGLTIEDIEKELEQMRYEEYAYGRTIDKLRMWDLLATKKFLQSKQ